MRFIITAAPDPDVSRARADAPPTLEDVAASMRFVEDMHRAGVLVAAEGLNPARKGARVGISGGKRVVLDGPFTESKELVGGFYLIDVPSMDEAIAWALRSPTGLGSDDVLTIHPMTEASDLPPEMVKIITDAAPTWSAAWRKPR